MESLVNQELLSTYRGKKVFITGHTGFKGAWLLLWLHSLGAEVKGYSLAPEDDNCLFSNIHKEINFSHVIADIRDKERLSTEILNFQPDFIFHLAAQALVRRSYEIPAETFEINVVGTANVLEAVKNDYCCMRDLCRPRIYIWRADAQCCHSVGHLSNIFHLSL